MSIHFPNKSIYSLKLIFVSSAFMYCMYERNKRLRRRQEKIPDAISSDSILLLISISHAESKTPHILSKLFNNRNK